MKFTEQYIKLIVESEKPKLKAGDKFKMVWFTYKPDVERPGGEEAIAFLDEGAVVQLVDTNMHDSSVGETYKVRLISNKDNKISVKTEKGETYEPVKGQILYISDDFLLNKSKMVKIK